MSTSRIVELNNELKKIQKARNSNITRAEVLREEVATRVSRLKSEFNVDLTKELKSGDYDALLVKLRKVFQEEKAEQDSQVALAEELVAAFNEGDYVRMNTLMGIEVDETSNVTEDEEEVAEEETALDDDISEDSIFGNEDEAEDKAEDESAESSEEPSDSSEFDADDDIFDVDSDDEEEPLSVSPSGDEKVVEAEEAVESDDDDDDDLFEFDLDSI